MKKSMYSLMLSEDVVNEIDKLAREQSTNRSNLINQILADRLKRSAELILQLGGIDHTVAEKLV